jgi:hypothetical protein
MIATWLPGLSLGPVLSKPSELVGVPSGLVGSGRNQVLWLRTAVQGELRRPT